MVKSATDIASLVKIICVQAEGLQKNLTDSIAFAGAKRQDHN